MSRSLVITNSGQCVEFACFHRSHVMKWYDLAKQFKTICGIPIKIDTLRTLLASRVLTFSPATCQHSVEVSAWQYQDFGGDEKVFRATGQGTSPRGSSMRSFVSVWVESSLANISGFWMPLLLYRRCSLVSPSLVNGHQVRRTSRR